METAEIAFAKTAIPALLDWRQRECDYGQLNGAPAPGVHARRGDHVEAATRKGHPLAGGGAGQGRIPFARMAGSHGGF